MADQTTQDRRELPLAPARARALLIAHSADASSVGKRFALDGKRYTLGRSAAGAGKIDDARLSREHCEIYLDASLGGYAVRDLTSKNGTFVGGARNERALLSNGSVLSIGDTVLVVDEEPPEGLLPEAGSDPHAAKEIVGSSAFAVALRRSVAAIARDDASVLILGDTGTGKEITARALHRLSKRSGECVALNCAAIPPHLMESELFGHKKGAFTGAEDDREGYIARSSGGTLFLDEIGELPAPLQAKLLRVVEERIVYPLGRGVPKTVDLRIVAATQVDIEKSGFRRDLFARLGDWVLRLLPLKERRADVVPLLEHFVQAFGPRPWTAEAIEALLLHEWPLNAREVRQMARRVATSAADSEVFDLPHLPRELQRPLLVRVNAQEGGAPDRERLEAALKLAGGNVKRASEELKCDRKSLYRWMNKYGIDPENFR